MKRLFYCFHIYIILVFPVCFAYLNRLYRDQAGIPLTVVCTVTGIGKLITPIIAQYYITDVKCQIPYNFKEYTSSLPKLPVINNQTSRKYTRHNESIPCEQVIHWSSTYGIPFFLLAVIGLLLSICYMFIYVIKVRPADVYALVPTTYSHKNQDSKTETKYWRIFFIYTSIFFIYFIYTAVISGIENFIYPIAVLSSLRTSSDSAALLNTLNHAMISISRIISIPILKCVPIDLFYNFYFVISALAGLVLACIGLKVRILIWILVPLMVYLMAPLSPTGYVYTALFTEVTGVVSMVIELGIGVGYIGSSLFSGMIFDNLGPRAVLVQIFLLTLVGAILSLTMLQLARRPLLDINSNET